MKRKKSEKDKKFANWRRAYGLGSSSKKYMESKEKKEKKDEDKR